MPRFRGFQSGTLSHKFVQPCRVAKIFLRPPTPPCSRCPEEIQTRRPLRRSAPHHPVRGSVVSVLSFLRHRENRGIVLVAALPRCATVFAILNRAGLRHLGGLSIENRKLKPQLDSRMV
jgi:hypothetical protein